MGILNKEMPNKTRMINMGILNKDMPLKWLQKVSITIT